MFLKKRLILNFLKLRSIKFVFYFLTGNGSSGQEDSEENNWALWGQIVTDWPNYSKKQSAQLKELVRKGIPHHFRGIVWQLLCSASDASIKKQYAEYIKATSACEKVIRRDIARTYPEHDFFKEKDGMGQESLFNVMKAYSLHDREVSQDRFLFCVCVFAFVKLI